MIDKMNPHYSMTNSSTVYDEEALTALELVGRTAAKMNETVEAVNEFFQTTEDHLAEQDADISERMEAQDNSITTMNDVTMPAKVVSEVQRHIDNGDFNAQIDAYAGNLERRVDNLLGSVTTGSTTLDAEVIDGRTGADNVVHPNLGEAIRNQHKHAMSKIYSPVEIERISSHVHSGNLHNYKDANNVIGGYYIETGELVAVDYLHQTRLIPIKPNTDYTASDKLGFVLFYDSSRQCIAKTTSTTFLENGYVTSPNNAAYARFITGNLYSLVVVEGRSIPRLVSHYQGYLARESLELNISPSDTTFIVAGGTNLLDKNDPNVIIDGYITKGGYLVTTSEADEYRFCQSGFIRVTPGKHYVSSYPLTFILWYNAERELIGVTESAEHTSNGVDAIDGAFWGRWVFTLDSWENAQVSEGSTLPPYDEYYPAINSAITVKPTALNVNFTSYGDSITARNDWQQHLVNHFTLHHTCLGIGSTTMAYVAEHDATYPCLVNATRIQQVKDSNPDIITILGGTNDAARGVPIGTQSELTKDIALKDKTTFYGALSYLVETLLTWKPTLNIIIMTTPLTNNAGYRDTYHQYAEAARDVARYYGLALADTNRESGITAFNTSTYTEDGVHLNAAGALRFANIVGDQIAKLYRMR